MNLNNPNLTAILGRVLVERQQLRFVGLDEQAELMCSILLSLELSLPETVSRDEDERSRHDGSFGRREAVPA